MPEMSQWSHVTGGIDLASLVFNVTPVQWEHTVSAHQAAAMWQIWTRAISQSCTGP